jgi:hypothetical protein
MGYIIACTYPMLWYCISLTRRWNMYMRVVISLCMCVQYALVSLQLWSNWGWGYSLAHCWLTNLFLRARLGHQTQLRSLIYNIHINFLVRPLDIPTKTILYGFSMEWAEGSLDYTLWRTLAWIDVFHKALSRTQDCNWKPARPSGKEGYLTKMYMYEQNSNFNLTTWIPSIRKW